MSFLKNFCASGIKESSRFDKRYNKWYDSCYMRTKTLPEFLPYRQKWYPEKIKVVPRDLILNKTIIAKWVGDDGCIRENSKNALILKFSTEGFTKEEVEFLTKLLTERYNGYFGVYRKDTDLLKENWIIKTSHISAVTLLKDINDEFVFLERKKKIWQPYINSDDYLKNKYRSKILDPAININLFHDVLLNKLPLTSRNISIQSKCFIDNKINIPNITLVYYYLKKYISLGYLEIKKINNPYLINSYYITGLGKQELSKLIL